MIINFPYIYYAIIERDFVVYRFMYGGISLLLLFNHVYSKHIDIKFVL